MWICDIIAENAEEAAASARRAIATAPFSYFDVYAESESTPVQVQVPNNGEFLDNVTAHPYYPSLPKRNN